MQWETLHHVYDTCFELHTMEALEHVYARFKLHTMEH